MRRNRLGCLSGIGIFAAMITAFLIAGFAFAGGGAMFSPGLLNDVHGDPLGGITSHAESAGACSICHVAPWEPQTMDDRCLVCHSDVPGQIGDIQTPHGRMYAIDPDAQCRDCHPEHRGALASLTEIADWKYPHQLSGYSLDGHQYTAEEQVFQCSDCHGLDVTIFDVKTCSTCHRQMDPEFTDNHIGAYGESCLNCHDGSDNLGKNFTHENFAFKLTGKHREVACVNCHVNARSLIDLKAAPQDCVSCHETDDPHRGGLGPDCASCHTPDNWRTIQFDHNRAAFVLFDSHAAVACERCHINNVFKGTPTDCFSCHNRDDRHNGELGTDCGFCHRPTKWQDITFNHAQTVFPLTGKHATVLCMDCHKNGTYKNVPTDCASCHVDVHAGQMGKDCAGCHTTTNWKDVNFDHGKTGFPLTGNHIAVACTSCHVNGIYKGTPKDCFACHSPEDVHKGKFGRDCASCHIPSGWKNVSFDHGKTAFPLMGRHTSVQCTACHVNNVFKGTPKDCVSCHASKDVHQGQFGTDCASCHAPSDWKNVTAFDHGRTAFPLNGMHVNIQCKSCHVNNVYKGIPKDCYSCHAAKDVHLGQFGTVCSACHNTSGWKNVTFDHGKTAFPLAGSHANLACGSCHVNNVYKGTPKNCFACHASRDAHGGQFGTDCGACHKPTKWADVTFDHGATNFPLTGLHNNVLCSSCHTNGIYKGTPTNCYACHASRDKHNGQFGTNCGSCHTTSGWANVTFDHQNTNFPLVGHHAQLACTSCHKNGVYQGTPVACIACHADKDKHNGQNGTDCSICHTPKDWGEVIQP